ncbi:MAG: 16S rRNA G966 N2-methylase RsmD [Bacteroidia bacterium]|jgi:16S rRNA G966 N2-methylase RsmD
MINAPLHDIVQSNEIIELLKNKEAIAFLTTHIKEKPDYLALKYKGKVGFDISKLTQILQLYQKAQDKIPLWVKRQCAMHAKSYAQCSHWKIAEFKSSLFNGNYLLDLTGGLGVDSYYFSQSFKHIVSLEKDTETHQFAVHNGLKLGISNTAFINASLEDFAFERQYDLIYLDPDRRVLEKRLLGDFESYSPNIVQGQDKWLQHANNLLIKLSPMVDLTQIENTFRNLKATYVIGYKNEVKEILIHLVKNEFHSATRYAVDISADKTTEFTVDERVPNLSPNSDGSFLLEPSKSLIKSGLAHSYCAEQGLHPIHPNGLYYLSDSIYEGFMGRQFRVLEKLPCNWKIIKKYIKSNKLKSIQITQRQFYEDVKSIRKKLKITEGGDTFLQFTIDHNGQAVCYHTKRA